MKTYLLPLLIALLFIPDLLHAQGELDEQETIFYNDERTWAFIGGTVGWGVNYRNGRRINAFKKRLWAIDLVGFNHPKELSLQNPWNPSSFFVYGKLNSSANFRVSYGLKKEIFRKVDKGGIAIDWFYMGGASLAWLKPIYYEIYHQQERYIYERKFNIDSFPSTDYIFGKASYFKGFSESTFVPGGFATTGLAFNFSQRNDKVLALEVGIAVDVFIQPIELMAVERNPMHFIQIYGSMRFGKIVDRMKVRLKKTRKKMEKKAKKAQKDNS